MSVEKNADFAERIKIAGLKSTIKLDNTKQAAPQIEYRSQINSPTKTPPSFPSKQESNAERAKANKAEAVTAALRNLVYKINDAIIGPQNQARISKNT